MATLLIDDKRVMNVDRTARTFAEGIAARGANRQAIGGSD